MHTWDPERYLTYADERGRPFVELLARVDATDPATVVDLGCGPGNLTALLVERWPAARVVGLDSSAEMIDKARATTPAVDFRVTDLRDWAAGADQVDVLVSNATLQWVPGHLDLLPDLVARVNPGGWLAFQVPGNFDEPSHTIRADLAAEPAYARALDSTRRRGGAVLARRRPRTCTRCTGSAARSTPGRRPTSTCSRARTRCSRGSRAPAPGRRSRRSRTVCASGSRRSTSGGSGRRTRPSDGRVVLPFRRIFVVARVTGGDRAAPRPGRLPAGWRAGRAGLLRRRARPGRGREAGGPAGPRRRVVPRVRRPRRRRRRAPRRRRGAVRARPQGAPGVRGRRPRRRGRAAARASASRWTSASGRRSRATCASTRSTRTATGSRCCNPDPRREITAASRRRTRRRTAPRGGSSGACAARPSDRRCTCTGRGPGDSR